MEEDRAAYIWVEEDRETGSLLPLPPSKLATNPALDAGEAAAGKPRTERVLSLLRVGPGDNAATGYGFDLQESCHRRAAGQLVSQVWVPLASPGRKLSFFYRLK